MFNRYYQQELQNLRELAVEFSKKHPVAAPLLTGQSPDPDVERLLEGVAFLNGLLRQKLDDEFPEIINSLMDIIFPHYLRPVPSLSIVLFEPKPALKEPFTVPAGTSLSSVPVEGTPCLFRTCFPTEVHPLSLRSVELSQKAGQPAELRMTLELSGMNLSQWKVKGLRFLLGGSYPQAFDLFLALSRYLKRIVIRAPGETPCVLSPSALIPVGFELENSLFPFPQQSFSGFRLLQEYFVQPLKFLFLELTGWENWRNRGAGSGFEVSFELLPLPFSLSGVAADRIILFATPVVNLFKLDADPVLLDHRSEKVRIRPAGKQKKHFNVYSVEKVSGHVQGSVARKEYVPFELFARSDAASPLYQVLRSRSPITDEPEVFLSFPYPPTGPEPQVETLSIGLVCTNGTLPEKLQVGDIRLPTTESPELMNFRNILPATYSIDPPAERNILWKFLSHLCLNYLPIANPENLKSLLWLYSFPEGRDRARVAANLKRIDGIVDVSVAPAHRLVRGSVVYGRKIEITALQDHFSSLGDLYLFASVLDRFFGIYSPMHTFTQLQLKENISGEVFVWPERMGKKPLVCV